MDAGKTTLTEQFLYLSGIIRKPGSVNAGTAQTDWLSIERERGISVRSAVARIEWKDCTINIIDTPGHIDFAGEAERALTALDGAVLVISAAEGIQSHAENIWKAFRRVNLPCIIFINKIDRAGSLACELIPQFEKRFDGEFMYITKPLTDGSRDCKIGHEPYELIMEKLADYDDETAEAYLSGIKLDPDTLDLKLKNMVCADKVTPVLCGSAQLGIGIGELLDAVVKYLPSAAPPFTEEKTRGELHGVVFKIEHDKDMGKIAHIRMFGGVIKNRDVIKNGEKITQIRRFNGAKYIDTGEVEAGDIAAVCGVESLKIGDVIGRLEEMNNKTKNKYLNISSNEYKLTHPFLCVKASPKTPDELTPLISAIKELSDEEPLINYKWEKSEREIQLNLTGEIQLEVIKSLLKERYDLEADFSSPSVIYKETPAKAGEGFEAYTMPKPCWAVVHFKFEPLARGAGVIYESLKIPHNQLHYKYQTHIETSFYESLEQGNYGWEVTDFKATLIGGEHHFLHTHPLDFFVATPMAVMNGLSNTGTILLEPLFKYRINAPEEYLGRTISDITGMRGEFDTPIVTKGVFEIEAIIPLAASLKYPVKLASLTGGKASYYCAFNGYKECALEIGMTAKRRGVNPLDRAKWILQARGAIQRQ